MEAKDNKDQGQQGATGVLVIAIHIYFWSHKWYVDSTGHKIRKTSGGGNDGIPKS